MLDHYRDHVKDLVLNLREKKIEPHIARIDGRKTQRLDGRSTCAEGYKVNQRKRNRIEEFFGWQKSGGRNAKYHLHLPSQKLDRRLPSGGVQPDADCETAERDMNRHQKSAEESDPLSVRWASKREREPISGMKP